MTIKAFFIIVAMVVFFTAAVIWISKNGGWDSEKGCHGDCASCKGRCEEQEALNELKKRRELQAKAEQTQTTNQDENKDL